MTSIPLTKILNNRSELRAVLHQLLNTPGTRFNVQDVSGNVIIGQSLDPAEPRHPVVVEDEALGYVAGGPVSASIAALLAYAARQEAEKRALASEVIDRYREINLLYRLSEKMADTLQINIIAGRALDEIMHMIRSKAGILIVTENPTAGFKIEAARGTPNRLVTACCLIEQVFSSGRAELANAVDAGEYFQDAQGELISLLCAPLITEERTIGAVILVGEWDRSYTSGELKLFSTIAQQVAVSIEICHLNQIAVEKARYEHELRMARQVQESLLPFEVPQIEDWVISQRWKPAREVSGDFYDIIQENPTQTGLVIADVTDKGMPAALFMVFVRSAIRASLHPGTSPAGAISAANRLICLDSHEGLFATLIYARLDQVSGEVTYVNAGHPPAMLYRKEQDDVSMLIRTGLPLGVEIDSPYQQDAVQLQPGDFILFVTDGITDAASLEQVEFGLERLKEAVYQLRSCEPDQIIAGLEQHLAEYTGPVRPADDLTMVVLKRIR